ncbi:hypothetical protein F383_16890 [Gossypium arboreum]|uniref:Uncharacterized protein n=1 Tax=Gossypium arboreum TaxID=29729 RepID=A0A0B0NRI8_GOSAR|nr:hypothetical protein F383_16890 [Gossypium arboreum]
MHISKYGMYKLELLWYVLRWVYHAM